MGLINVENYFLFQSLTFLSCILNNKPHNELLMVLNSLIDFCFGGGESNILGETKLIFRFTGKTAKKQGRLVSKIKIILFNF